MDAEIGATSTTAAAAAAADTRRANLTAAATPATAGGHRGRAAVGVFGVRLHSSQKHPQLGCDSTRRHTPPVQLSSSPASHQSNQTLSEKSHPGDTGSRTEATSRA
uniref:Uncharacterized protein n=1 Tax=Plectus sambesii TaxID=2011161 RepID=A0A914V7B4_9BILA